MMKIPKSEVAYHKPKQA